MASYYGANEFHSIAYECPYGNMHLMSGNVYVEVLNDNKECVAGEEGEVYVTSLTNSVMPLIRYQIGDRGKIEAGKKCMCGNHSPVIVVSGIVGTRLSHKINGDNFSLETNGVLYAAGEEITIHASDVKIAGLVYAPKGTVTINADTVELTGLIVAEKIVMNAGEIREYPDRDLKAVYDEVQIAFYPEILVTSVEEENQVEIYGGNINVKNMEIYTRENRAPEFQKKYEVKGNEYQFLLPETVQEIDIRVKCTNVFGEEE